MKKVVKELKNFTEVLCIVSMLMCPLFALKTILVLTQYMDTKYAYAVGTAIWCVYFVLVCVMLVKPWRSRTSKKELA
jgi:multidrug transporter EmrE-like cation transporter